MGKILHIEERYLNAGHTKVEIYELKIFIIQKNLYQHWDTFTNK